MSWLPLALVLIAALIDLRTREIPDAIPVCLLAWAIGTAVFGDAEPAWAGRGIGLLVGLGVGMGLFATGAFGGGDVKLLAALGAVMGWPSVVSLLYYSALAGGALALVASVRGHTELAYAPAMAIGLLLLIALNP